MSIETFNAAIAAAGDLNTAIAASGYTRGTAHRGRIMLTGDDVIVAEYDYVDILASDRTYFAKYAFPTADAAMAYVKTGRPDEAATLRRIAAENQAINDRLQMDGPTGHGW